MRQAAPALSGRTRCRSRGRATSSRSTLTPPDSRHSAREAALRGKRVAVLPSAAYGGTKDVSAAGVLALEGWLAVSAVLDLPEALQEQWQERVAIMAVDGGVSEAEVQRLPRLDASSGLYDTPRQYHASGYAMIGGWHQLWQRSSLAPHTTQEAEDRRW